MRLPRATVIIVNTNELEHLERCLPSVLKQQYDEYEILLVDNDSTDGSVEYVRREFPEVKVIENSANLGYAGANNVGFEHGNGAYLVVLNPDTEVEPNWLRELVIALENTQSAGLATSKILMMDEPQRVNACGNEITFTGMTFCRGLGQPADTFIQPEAVGAISGASFGIKRSVLEDIGPFDDGYFIYYEDTDLSLRAALAGYDCLYVPSSVAYHKYAFRLSAKKTFFVERNRLLSWLKVFRWGTLVALFPMLVLAEVLAWGYVILHGSDYVRQKAESYVWIIRNWRQIMEARHQTQALRRTRDRQLLCKMSHRLSFAGLSGRQLAPVLEAVVQPLLWLWGGLCRTLVVW